MSGETTKPIRLFGFQDGPDGFVCAGTPVPGGDGLWRDYLYLLAHGGRGSGKSRGGAYRVLRYVLAWPKSRGVVTAPTMFMMNDSTRATLTEVFEEAGLMEERDWTYTATREEINLFNGSKILLRSTEHPERLRGLNLAYFWMDEPRDSPYPAFLNLQACLRQRGFPLQAWLTSTPAGRQHWMHKVWFPEEHANDPDSIASDRGIGTYRHMGALTRDNPYNGDAYYQSLIRTYGENTLLARQELRGEFVLMEGLTYPDWDREVFMTPMESWSTQKPKIILAGVDFGFKNPSAILVGGLDEDDNYYLLDGLYKRGLAQEELAREAKRLRARWGIRFFVCDAEDPGWIAAFRREGLLCINAYKRHGNRRNFSYGVGLCSMVLQRRDTRGKPKFFVNPALREFAAEIEDYVDMDGTDMKNMPERPRSKDNHYMDAWRYLMNELYRRWGQQGIVRKPRVLDMKIGV